MPVKLYKYILHKFMVSFFIGLAVFTALLMMDQASRQIDQIAYNYQNFGQFLLSYGLLIPPPLTYSIPLAFLMAMISTVDQMKQDHELTAILTTGVSPLTIMVPFTAAASIVFLGVLLINTIISPISMAAYNDQITEISRHAIFKGLKSGSFFKGLPGTVMLVGEYGGDSGKLGGVLLVKSRSDSDEEMILARKGTLTVPESGSSSSISMVLENGSIHPVSKHSAGYRSVSFNTLTAKFQRTSDRRILGSKFRLMASSSSQLRSLASAPDPENPRKQSEAIIEIHRRFSLPVAILFYPFIVFPLAVSSGKHGKAAAFGASITLFVITLFVFSVGSSLGVSGALPAAAGAWLHILVLAPASLAVFAPFAIRHAPVGWPFTGRAGK